MIEAAHKRPDLTMPEAEAELLRQHYEDADVILEYGSGGSTVMASEMEGKHITSVESDKAWWKMMMEWFETNPASKGSTVDMLYADIGPTREWGHSKDERSWKQFAQYPLAVWEMDELRAPDVVLVDGRFRVGCALATAYNIKQSTVLLFDDYTPRKWMHATENFLGQPEITGRMATFKLEPQPFPTGRMLEIIDYMLRP